MGAGSPPLPGEEQHDAWVDFFFKAQSRTGTPHLLAPHKAAQLRSFMLAQLPEYLVPQEQPDVNRFGRYLPALFWVVIG